ncbi:hypothetical protein LBMAG42_07300 [Deltaproteobacteria bacterium]|nr:hypothetical protein LBMAG42_07300 [Deltaproteobacteria bacterium]
MITTEGEHPSVLGGGRYEVRGVLGAGGMATVYRVWDRRLKVDRAIKVLHPAMVDKQNIRRRFETEASTMARIQHPNIASVFDVGEDGDALFMVMELISGGSLSDLVSRQGVLTPRQAAETFACVCDALQVAHEAGVIHRDIKPQNILVTREGVPKVTDFGIAHVEADDAPSMTRTGSVMGTWGYMPPEQRAGARQLDGRTDVYAVGASLVGVVTGDLPGDLFVSELHDRLLGDVHPVLRAIVVRATRYAQGDRYASASALAVALREAALQLTVADEEAGAPRIPGATLPVPTFALDEDPPDARPLSGETFAPGDLAAGGPSVVIEAPTRPAPAGFSASRRWLLTFALGFGLLLGIGVPVGLWGSGAFAPGGENGALREDVAAGAPAQGEPRAAEPAPAEGVAPAPAAEVPAPIVAKVEPAPSGGAAPKGQPPPSKAVVGRATGAGVGMGAGAAPPVATPTVKPAPVPVAAPPVAEVAAPPPAAGPASFKAAGDADAVFLVAGGKRYPPGELPAGTYTIEASFAGQAPTAAGTITLAAGQAATVKCNGSFMKCR